MGTIHHRNGIPRRSSEAARVVVTTIIGLIFGFFIGITFRSFSVTKINLPSNIFSSIDASTFYGHRPEGGDDQLVSNPGSDEGKIYYSGNTPRIYVPTNPRGAELLPPGIVVTETDFYLRRLWGNPNEDLTNRPKYLVTFTVGINQRNNIDAAVRKFSGDDFQILLFHYDGRTSEWDQFEWSKRAVHVSARRQTKWWYAKRFLHPDIVAAYDYIFIWDEDLGVEHFNAENQVWSQIKD